MTRLLVIAATLLAALPAAAPAQAPAAAVTVPTATLLTYVGTYANERGIEAAVALDLGGGLTIAINSPPLAMRAISPTQFAVDEKQARITFDAPGGKVAGLTVKMKSREAYFSRVK